MEERYSFTNAAAGFYAGLTCVAGIAGNLSAGDLTTNFCIAAGIYSAPRLVDKLRVSATCVDNDNNPS